MTRPKPLPPEEHERTLRRVRVLAALMDGQWEVPGTSLRFGLDALIGLIPAGGDAITALVSLYLVAEARRLGVRPRTLRRMLANVLVDALVGAIPLLGDLFDVAYRANARNLRLLELDLLEQRASAQ